MNAEKDKLYKFYTYERFNIIADENDCVLYYKLSKTNSIIWSTPLGKMNISELHVTPTSVIPISEKEIFLELL